MKSVKPSSSESENDKFTSALSKVLSADHASVQAAIEAAKEEPLSRHTKYKYDPAKPRD